MNGKILLVIDMQVDFTTGALANEDAVRIISAVKDKIEEYKIKNQPVFFTRDTHKDDYLSTQEGKLLPVPHCILGSAGWQIVPELIEYSHEGNTVNKPSFGYYDLPKWIEENIGDIPEEIELCGVCTDICVISNAMILKGAFSETKIKVDGACCAGVTPESHFTALEAMKGCQIIVK